MCFLLYQNIYCACSAFAACLFFTTSTICATSVLVRPAVSTITLIDPELAETITSSKIVAYDDLGAEAIYKLEVKEFYAIVTYDANGGDLFEEGKEKYKNI